jgi:hypothetical protein
MSASCTSKTRSLQHSSYWEERFRNAEFLICGNKLVLVGKISRSRIRKCVKCNFREDRDNILLYWAIKRLLTLKGEVSNIR